MRRLQCVRGLDTYQTKTGAIELTKDEKFRCPKCQANYKVVRVSSGGQAISRALHCKVCKEPLAPTDDGKILKYFLVGRPSVVSGA